MSYLFLVDGLETFTRFLKTEFSEENIEFWIACEDFKKSKDPQQIICKAKAIYEKFIRNDAPQEVKMTVKMYICLKTFWENMTSSNQYFYTFYLILLPFTFTAFCRYCVKLKVCDSSALSKSISAIFPTILAHLLSLCHILIIFAIFLAFTSLLCLLWWSVISVLWYYYYDLLKAQMMVSLFFQQ